ncbi:MAG: N-acetylmuramoyl-L-alanine amidase [Lachnospiraceae bacterium]|nr:N-acetylmuramoyl-L-alanine amidase [Lachnospiraceae bacterium]
MKNNFLNTLMIQCILFASVLFGFCIWHSFYGTPTKIVESAKMVVKSTEKSIIQATPKVELSDEVVRTNNITKKLGNNYIKIKKTTNQLYPASVREIDETKQVEIVVFQMSQLFIENDGISLIKNGRQIDNNSSEGKLFQEKVQVTFDGKSQIANILIAMDDYYGYILYEDEDYIYVVYKEPKEVYDRIIVLDAGHGGKDVGSEAVFGEWYEKDYNLDIVERIVKNWNLDNGKIYLTRWEDDFYSLSDRVKFANSLKADLFVSVHCNSADDFDGTGIEVLYKSNSQKQKSKNLARKFVNELQQSTGLVNRGVLDGNSIYIIHNSKMPTVLLEMGFLTDKKDLKYLAKAENRETMAKTVCDVLAND